LLNWAKWTGNAIVWPASAGGLPVFDAAFTAPTNDWHLVSLLNDYFNINDPRSLSSPNLATAQDWERLLDGITVLTNTGPSQFTPLVISSNSPQAALVAEALVNSRSAQSTGLFGSVGDILSTPELSVASPFLSAGNFGTISDAALEAIPSQLISRLRPDSMATVVPGGPPALIRFTGMDGYSYMVQSSTDLMTWTTVSTNTPENGFFVFSSPLTNSSIFYRSLLQP
jgi:hypothetical protein